MLNPIQAWPCVYPRLQGGIDNDGAETDRVKSVDG